MSEVPNKLWLAPWIGEVPLSWIHTRLKFGLSDTVAGGTPDTSDERNWTDPPGGTPWVAISDMTRSSRVRSTEKSVTERGLREKRMRVLPAGSLLYSMYASLGKVAILEVEAVTNQAILALIPRERLIDQRFLRWWLEDCEPHVGYFSSSNTQDNLNAEKARNIPLCYPPLPEQQAIAAFLDDKTARIDELVRKKERLIELLQEKRQALITQAVTKGLDPDVPMKDSGVEWLGEVPAHWEVKALKRDTRVQRGASPRPIDDPHYFDEEGEYAWVRIADATASRGHLMATTQRLSDLGASLSVKMQPGGLFLSIAGTVGLPCVAGIKCCIHDGFVYFPSLSMNRDFLFRIFEAGECYKGLGKLGTQLNLNTDTVGWIQLPFPPREEQDQIAAYLDTGTAKLDNLADKLRRHIDLLKEYRQALISAAVTGKIEVPA